MERYKVIFETDGFISFYAFVFLHYRRLAVEMQNLTNRDSRIMLRSSRGLEGCTLCYSFQRRPFLCSFFTAIT
jgi:hypothetical protein